MKKVFCLFMAVVFAVMFAQCAKSDKASAGEPEIVADGGAAAVIENGVLSVTYPDDSYISDITIDGNRVWLTDDTYCIGDTSSISEINVDAEKCPEYAENNEMSSVLLSIYDSKTNSYSVTWHTDSISHSTVMLGWDGNSQQKIITAYSDEGNGDYVNRAVFYNLEYNTDYSYTIYDSFGNECYSSSFSTGEENPQEITFMHVSDTQDETYNGTVWNQLMTDAYSHTENLDFIIHTGDMVQYGGNEDLWSMMLGNVSDYVSSVPTMLTSGNHSYWSDYTGGASEIEYNHTTVNLPEQDCENGIYYSFDYSDIHFTVLSSGDSERTGVGSKQREWLENDLKSTDKKWKIVAIHNPLYSPGKYGSSRDRNKIARSQQKKLGKIFNEYSVDLVLEGHDHAFAVTKPMDENRNPVGCETETQQFGDSQAIYLQKPAAPVYLMSAAGGSQNREVVDTYEPSWFLKAQSIPDNTAGYSIITVSENTLTSTFYEYNYADDAVTSTYSWGIVK